MVTWQMKSENIYFEGEKSTALEEQVKAQIESKLESGNAELMSDSEQQQQSVDDSTLSSRGEPDTSVSNDIHIKENDAGRREPIETFWASNNEKYIANEAVMDQDLKRDEDHSHKECSKYANSPNATLLGRPSTFDNPRIAETKYSFNSRGSANKTYTNYSTYDPEIIMLKYKFEKFTDNVVTRLDELAFEINVVKENKPYSVVTLEGVIDELKKEKAELFRKNEALRESNNNMQQTISQLSQTKKQLEEEKSSLITAIKIIQNDFNQQAISKKKSGEAREEIGGGIDDNTWEKSMSKHQSKRLISLLSNSGDFTTVFTTVRRRHIPELKLKHEHIKDKTSYYTENGKCQIHLIIGDNTFSRIRTENVSKGEQGDPIVEETSFGWVIHGGDDYTDDQCMFTRETSDCERLYSLDVLGVEDRGDTNSEILNEFTENITRKGAGGMGSVFRGFQGNDRRIQTNSRVENGYRMSIEN